MTNQSDHDEPVIDTEAILLKSSNAYSKSNNQNADSWQSSTNGDTFLSIDKRKRENKIRARRHDERSRKWDSKQQGSKFGVVEARAFQHRYRG